MAMYLSHVTGKVEVDKRLVFWNGFSRHNLLQYFMSVMMVNIAEVNG